MDEFKNISHLFHEETRQFLDAMQQFNMLRFDQLGSVEVVRELTEKANTVAAGQVDYEGRRDEYFVRSADVPGGIPVYVYVPNNHGTNPPILVYCHGGGNVIGSRMSVETTCKILSSNAGCIVVNVEYRLAPEHTMPAGLEDCCHVTRWVLGNLENIGGGPLSKIGVSGDSAGGQIAAGIVHEVPGVAFQILIYPHVGPNGDRSLISFQEYKNGPVLDEDAIKWFEKHMSDASEWRNPRNASILRDKFDHLPPCLLVVAECDPIRDESFEYAKKLTAAGVHNEMHLARGAIHSFYTLPAAFPKLCAAAYSKTVEFIKRWGRAVDDSKY